MVHGRMGTCNMIKELETAGADNAGEWCWSVRRRTSALEMWTHQVDANWSNASKFLIRCRVRDQVYFLCTTEDEREDKDWTDLFNLGSKMAFNFRAATRYQWRSTATNTLCLSATRKNPTAASIRSLRRVAADFCHAPLLCLSQVSLTLIRLRSLIHWDFLTPSGPIVRTFTCG